MLIRVLLLVELKFLVKHTKFYTFREKSNLYKIFNKKKAYNARTAFSKFSKNRKKDISL